MTLTGCSLRDVPNRFDWRDVCDFVRYLDASSALVSEMRPDEAGWQGDEKTPMLLAHIADLLAGLSYGYVLTHLKKNATKPKAPAPIPRPGITPSQASDKKLGSGAISVADFDSWWDSIDKPEEEDADG